MRTQLAGCLITLLTLACADAPEPSGNSDLVDAQSVTSTYTAPFYTIDLTRIKHVAAKGRIQDKEYNDLDVVDHLISTGPRSIPFLISKLEDETPLEGRVIDYWDEVTVGDVAHIVLTDFFTDSTWKNTTIPGISWDELLERRNTSITGEQVLREYVERHGRRGIIRKWVKVWEEYKDRLYWDEKELCFKVRSA